MTGEERRRLQEAMAGWCSNSYLRDLLDIDLEHDSRLSGDFRAWATRFLSPGHNAVMRPGQTNRFLFERFLQFSKLLPRKLAAVRLGMTLESFELVIKALFDKGIALPGLTQEADQVVEEPAIRSFYTLFPRLTGRIFSNNDEYCRRLHNEIRKDLGVKVDPVHCVTATFLGEASPDYAHEFDFITLKPIGLRYQVWLDTKKPASLRPDACSTLFYWQNEASLRGMVMGHADIPPALQNARRRTPRPHH